MSDETLVLGVLSGDREAFAELYDRRARLIRAVCLDATGDIDAAVDLTQEVFLRAFERLATLREPKRFAAWLVGIARQVCREWRRNRLRERSRRRAFAVEPAAPPEGRHPDEQVARVREALAALPAKERLGLHAFYLQGLDAEQARIVLGLSRSGFYRVLSCARQRLRILLQRVEVTS